MFSEMKISVYLKKDVETSASLLPILWFFNFEHT